MTEGKYRTHEICQFDYSDIWEKSFDERYTDTPLRNDEIIKLLNEQEEEIQRLKWSNKILRANKKNCELGRREERKRWIKMDEMRIEHIRLLQKRLKKNGLSIYVNGDVDD